MRTCSIQIFQVTFVIKLLRLRLFRTKIFYMLKILYAKYFQMFNMINKIFYCFTFAVNQLMSLGCQISANVCPYASRLIIVTPLLEFQSFWLRSISCIVKSYSGKEKKWDHPLIGISIWCNYIQQLLHAIHSNSLTTFFYFYSFFLIFRVRLGSAYFAD